MTNKELILECLSEDDEAFTQIVEYFELPPARNVSRSEIIDALEEMIEEGYVFINYKWKTENNEYPFSLTDAGKEAWKKFRISWDDFLERYLKCKHGFFCCRAVCEPPRHWDKDGEQVQECIRSPL